jgi:hypothetical protein
MGGDRIAEFGEPWLAKRSTREIPKQMEMKRVVDRDDRVDIVSLAPSDAAIERGGSTYNVWLRRVADNDIPAVVFEQPLSRSDFLSATPRVRRPPIRYEKYCLGHLHIPEVF